MHEGKEDRRRRPHGRATRTTSSSHRGGPADQIARRSRDQEPVGISHEESAAQYAKLGARAGPYDPLRTTRDTLRTALQMRSDDPCVFAELKQRFPMPPPMQYYTDEVWLRDGYTWDTEARHERVVITLLGLWLLHGRPSDFKMAAHVNNSMRGFLRRSKRARPDDPDVAAVSLETLLREQLPRRPAGSPGAVARGPAGRRLIGPPGCRPRSTTTSTRRSTARSAPRSSHATSPSAGTSERITCRRGTGSARCTPSVRRVAPRRTTSSFRAGRPRSSDRPTTSASARCSRCRSRSNCTSAGAWRSTTARTRTTSAAT